MVQRRMNRRPQVREHVPPLLAARLDDAFEVGGEGVAPVALAAEARLPPGDQATQLPLGVIVRWLDRGIVDKAPQSIAMFEDVATRSANAGDRQISTFFEQPFDGAPESERDALQSCARTGAVSRAVIAVIPHVGAGSGLHPVNGYPLFASWRNLALSMCGERVRVLSLAGVRGISPASK